MYLLPVSMYTYTYTYVGTWHRKVVVSSFRNSELSENFETIKHLLLNVGDEGRCVICLSTNVRITSRGDYETEKKRKRRKFEVGTDLYLLTGVCIRQSCTVYSLRHSNTYILLFKYVWTKYGSCQTLLFSVYVERASILK